MGWKSFWHSVGRDIESAATGVSHFATHVVDKTSEVVESLGNDTVKISHEAGGAVSSVGSSLAMPMTIGARALGAFFLMKQR